MFKAGVSLRAMCVCLAAFVAVPDYSGMAAEPSNVARSSVNVKSLVLRALVNETPARRAVGAIETPQGLL
ncbi:MAG: hypothetical protein EOM37_04655 [Proteobacteria bacterium]|nr:hypothetical protein [Pseudomonadota bacterium]